MDAWYVACLTRDLLDRPVARTVLGTPMVLFRAPTGEAGVLEDRCAHRNVPLSLGRCHADGIECRYHGWRFGSDGGCRAVPGLVDDDRGADRTARRVASFPVLEQDGLVWVAPTGTAPAAPPYRLPRAGDRAYATVQRSQVVTGSLHAVLENALDVPHTAFLHKGLFRGNRAPVPIDATVRRTPEGVEAIYEGEPRPTGLAARVLSPRGGVVEHADRFLLPSLAQVEYRLDRHHLVITTACTPVDATHTALHATVTFRAPIPDAVARALVTPIAGRILRQDAWILAEQAANLRRFGGEHFANTRIDVLGPHIARLLRRFEQGEPVDDAIPEERVTLLV